VDAIGAGLGRVILLAVVVDQLPAVLGQLAHGLLDQGVLVGDTEVVRLLAGELQGEVVASPEGAGSHGQHGRDDPHAVRVVSPDEAVLRLERHVAAVVLGHLQKTRHELQVGVGGSAQVDVRRVGLHQELLVVCLSRNDPRQDLLDRDVM